MNTDLPGRAGRSAHADAARQRAVGSCGRREALCFGDRVTGEDGGADGVGDARGGPGAGQPKGGDPGEAW